MMNHYLIQRRIVRLNVIQSIDVHSIVIVINKRIDAVWKYSQRCPRIECVWKMNSVVGIWSVRMDFANVQRKISCQQKINENAVRKKPSVMCWNHPSKFCILVSLLLYPSENSSCHSSPFGCCRDNQTIAPTFDRRGCPG